MESHRTTADSMTHEKRSGNTPEGGAKVELQVVKLSPCYPSPSLSSAQVDKIQLSGMARTTMSQEEENKDLERHEVLCGMMWAGNDVNMLGKWAGTGAEPAL
ncbi:hypothetical protein Aduo_000275 [Ancylostoma duodenale]